MDKLPLTAKILSIFVLSFMTILLWVEFLIDVKGWSEWNEAKCIVLSINFVFEWMARSMLYIYYMYRSRNVFRGTALEMREYFYKTMVGWFIITYTICATTILLWGFYYHCPPWTSDIVKYLVLWVFINETLSQMFCLCYFVFKMRKLIKESAFEGIKQIKYVTKKLLILAVCYNVMAGVNLILAERGLYFVRALEHFTVCICMVLSFGFMDKTYKRMCYLCISCCTNCCN